MRRSVVAVVVGAAVLGGAAPSGAQSPSYGGGLLPAASPPRGYHPTMGIVLQPRGAAIALRFDTSILCGRESYQPAGRAGQEGPVPKSPSTEQMARANHGPHPREHARRSRRT